MKPSIAQTSYHSQLAQAADRLLFVCGLLFGLASLGISI
jgi:hypothetical protein